MLQGAICQWNERAEYNITERETPTGVQEVEHFLCD